VDGVTTVLGDGIPKPGLITWAARETAGYAVDHWEELAALPISKRQRQLEGARYETTNTAKVRGTTVHKLAQRLAAGEEVEVPEHLTGYVDSYLSFAEEWQPAEQLVEAPVFNRTLRYAGTLDLLAGLRDDRAWLLDYKTGQSGVFPESALQLAAYRYAEFYLDGGGEEHPLPPIDACGCVWLRADGYDLLPVDAGEEAFLLFRYAQALARGFVRQSRERFVLEALTP
jgi:hypothetical protein